MIVTWAHSLAWIEYEVADSISFAKENLAKKAGEDLATGVQIPVGPSLSPKKSMDGKDVFLGAASF